MDGTPDATHTLQQRPKSHDAHCVANVAFFSGELPHESKDEVFRLLHVRSKYKQHPLLASFIDLSLSAIRDEINRLPHYLRKLVPPFENIIDIADAEHDLRRGLLCGAAERMVLCLLKLGLFIAYYDCHPDEYSWGQGNSCNLGMGVGMLMCGAVSMSPRLSDFPAAAAETVGLAFRFGVFVGDFSRSIEPVETGESPKSYVCAIMGQDEHTVRQALDERQGINVPPSSRVMVCNVRNCSTSVDGPPEKIMTLKNDDSFFGHCKKHIMTAYGGICHAPDVYGEGHALSIARSISLPGRSTSPVLSLVTGSPYRGGTAAELFQRICQDVLMEPVRWEANLAGAIDHVRASAADACTIFEASPSPPMGDLALRLSQHMPNIKVRNVNLISWLKSSPIVDDRPRGNAQSKLAIVGMSCRFPGGADGNEEFWELLMQGADVHRVVPSDRFDIGSHYDPTGAKLNASKTPFGCFIDDPSLFDPHFFNMSPNEARQTDPMHRLALVTAYEALEMAGHVNGQSNIDPSRVGTFYGQASDDYREVNSGQEISTYFISGGCRAFAPGRINYFFKFSGPSYSIDTACSSALATIQEACESLWAGNIDMAVAGGLNVLTNCDVYAGLSHGHFLSPTGGCKTWDANADGYCRADGVGTFVIKRLEDAQADNDNVLGVILSAATNHSANAISITHPHAPTQEALYRKVVNRAGIDPLSVGYVEMHGTGTQAGDLNETTSITNVFAPLGPARKSREQTKPLYIGTVKANMGHGEAAAGSMALAKALLVLKHSVIPPHVGIKNGVSPNFPKERKRRNLHIPLAATSWERKQLPRTAIVNNFGAAGGNTTLILQDGPLQHKSTAIPMTYLPFVFSAKGRLKDSPSLETKIRQMLEYLHAHPNVSLANLSYTLCARRMHHTHRMALTARSVDDLKAKLVERLATSFRASVVNKSTPRIAFVFTGQGSFYNGIARDLYQGHAFFRDTINHLDYMVQNNGFSSTLPVFEGTADEGQQASAVLQQLSILVCELGLIKFWEYLGVTPDVVVGHSLGEYAALCAAGVLSTSEAIFLVGSRAKMLEQSCTPGAYVMLAVQGTPQRIADQAGVYKYEVACINGPSDTVIAGPKSDMGFICNALKADGVKVTTLEIPYAFHSAQMDAVLEQVRELCSGLVFRKPLVPVISPLLRAVVTQPGVFDTSYVLRATREAVDFVGAVHAAANDQVIRPDTVFLEIGPRPICSAFVRNIVPDCKHVTYSLKPKEDNWASLASSLTLLYQVGVSLHWRELFKPFERDSLTLLDLPRYPWNNQSYWIQYTGDWCLTKGLPRASAIAPPSNLLSSSTAQRVIEERINSGIARVVVESDVLEPHLLAAIEGHRMNGVGVLSSFIHADAAYAVASLWYRKAHGTQTAADMDLTDFDYHNPIVPQKNNEVQQIWKMVAEGFIADNTVTIKFFHPQDDEGKSNAHVTVRFGNAISWLSDWSSLAHLICSRVQQLKDEAGKGNVSQVQKRMAYKLFSKLVDYSPEYWNMDSVVLNGLEAVADVTLPTLPAGRWSCCPYALDAFASLPGFILNAGDAVDNEKFFYLTPHWASMRLAKPLTPGNKYQSYVRMAQDPTKPRIYKGDIYLLHDGEIIGVVKQIEFWAWKRHQLAEFFKQSASSEGISKNAAAKMAIVEAMQQNAYEQSEAVTSMLTPPLTPPATSRNERSEALEGFSLQAADQDFTPLIRGPSKDALDSVTERAIRIIAEETELEVGDLDDDAMLADLGIDSLMCLELAGRFRSELKIEVRDALFVEVPKMGDLKKYLSENFGS